MALTAQCLRLFATKSQLQDSFQLDWVEFYGFTPNQLLVFSSTQTDCFYFERWFHKNENKIRQNMPMKSRHFFRFSSWITLSSLISVFRFNHPVFVSKIATCKIVTRIFIDSVSQSNKDHVIKLQRKEILTEKKRLWHRYFPVSFGKFLILRTPFLENTSAAFKQNWKKCYSSYNRPYLGRIWSQYTVWVLKLYNFF